MQKSTPDEAQKCLPEILQKYTESHAYRHLRATVIEISRDLGPDTPVGRGAGVDEREDTLELGVHLNRARFQ